MAPTILVFAAMNLGDDVLQVDGSVNGKPVTATGWVSALTHYVQAPGGAQAPATPAEARAYCEGLLSTAVTATPPVPVAGVPLDPEPPVL